MSLYEMRRSYTLGALLETDIDGDPVVQFRRWLDEATEAEAPSWLEVNAMTLATSDGENSVSSRVVLLKALEENKFWFYTNYTSQKARQMEQTKRASLCFLWQHVQRQVRVEGSVERAPREHSEEYFRTRPRASQLGAHVSDQSAPISDRQVLETKLDELEKQYAGKEIPCPEHWGGYAVTPTKIEFWQGRESRLHDRIVYERSDDQWHIRRLAP